MYRGFSMYYNIIFTRDIIHRGPERGWYYPNLNILVANDQLVAGTVGGSA